MGISDRPDNENIGCGYTSFEGISEVKSLIETLNDVDQPFRTVEKNLDRFTFILRQYQDQPHLLDPYLEEIIGPLMAIFRDKKSLESARHNMFKYMYVVMSVKTYKKIVTYLPHEVCVKCLISGFTEFWKFYGVGDKWRNI